MPITPTQALMLTDEQEEVYTQLLSYIDTNLLRLWNTAHHRGFVVFDWPEWVPKAERVFYAPLIRRDYDAVGWDVSFRPDYMSFLSKENWVR